MRILFFHIRQFGTSLRTDADGATAMPESRHSVFNGMIVWTR